jgi:hypothetical protein
VKNQKGPGQADVAATVEPPHVPRISLLKRRSQSPFRFRIACANRRVDRDRRYQPRVECRTGARYQKHGAPPLKIRRAYRRHSECLVGRKRKDQAPAILQTVQPTVCGPCRAGADIDDIGGVERHDGAIAFDYRDLRTGGEVGASSRRELMFVFDRGDASRCSHQRCEERAVVAGTGTDMHHVLATDRISRRHQEGV